MPHGGLDDLGAHLRDPVGVARHLGGQGAVRVGVGAIGFRRRGARSRRECERAQQYRAEEGD